MISPNEIANKQFDKVMGRGYRPEDVDAYLRQVADSMDELMAEKQELEDKIMVLADKLEEYKYDEESFRAALLGAQKLGDSVVRESKAKAKALLEDAETEAKLIKESALKEIENQHSSYTRIQREVSTFKSKLQILYRQHLELIASIPAEDNTPGKSASASSKPKYTADPEPEELPEVLEPLLPEDDGAFSELPPLEEVTEDDFEGLVDTGLDDMDLGYGEKSLEFSRGFEDDQFDEKPSSDDEYIPSSRREEKPSSRESKFGPLKFGKDYDIKRDGRKK